MASTRAMARPRPARSWPPTSPDTASWAAWAPDARCACRHRSRRAGQRRRRRERRRRRRDCRLRSQRHARLPRSPEENRRRARPTAACAPATSDTSTLTVISSSPGASRSNTSWQRQVCQPGAPRGTAEAVTVDRQRPHPRSTVVLTTSRWWFRTPGLRTIPTRTRASVPRSIAFGRLEAVRARDRVRADRRGFSRPTTCDAVDEDQASQRRGAPRGEARRALSGQGVAGASTASPAGWLGNGRQCENGCGNFGPRTGRDQECVVSSSDALMTGGTDADFDAIVVGGGPAGIPAPASDALEARGSPSSTARHSLA